MNSSVSNGAGVMEWVKLLGVLAVLLFMLVREWKKGAAQEELDASPDEYLMHSTHRNNSSPTLTLLPPSDEHRSDESLFI